MLSGLACWLAPQPPPALRFGAGTFPLRGDRPVGIRAASKCRIQTATEHRKRESTREGVLISQPCRIVAKYDTFQGDCPWTSVPVEFVRNAVRLVRHIALRHLQVTDPL